MKKYISLFLCAFMAFAACQPVGPDPDEQEVYQGIKASVEMSSSDPVPAEGGSLVVTVNDSPAFTVSLPKTATWLSCSQSDNVLTFTASANKSAVLRYARVSIIDADLKIAITNFEVIQSGTEKEAVRKKFSVSPDSIEAKADDTQATIKVNSEVVWKAVSNNTAFTVSPAQGSGDGTITVSFPANTTDQVVTAEVTVSTDDADAVASSFTVSIKQAASNAGKPAVKPAPGTVLAEWLFDTDQVDALKEGGIESVSAEDDNAPGNVGNPYVPSNVSGNGRLEYYNGSDKSSVSTSKRKRRIGERGEPCIYCCWEGDWFTWTAELDAPLAAGTKFKLNFVLRPSSEQCMKYWKCEYLDGDKWVELETISLDFHKDAQGTAEDPKQINCFINETATLTADTPRAQFRFTCTQNAQCGDGSPLSAINTKYVLRFAGKWSNASEENKYLQVPENPRIVVVE